jgi:NADH-quinone oxidoreductase subunit K
VLAPLPFYLILSAVLFSLGVFGFLYRKNPLIMFMSIELMLNAANLTFVSFARYLGSFNGQVIVFFILTIAAAEVVVGLGIIVSIFRVRADIDVDDIHLLRG